MSRLSPTSFYRSLGRLDFAARRLGLIALLGSGVFFVARLCTGDQLLTGFSILMLSFAAIAVTKRHFGVGIPALLATALLFIFTTGQPTLANRGVSTTPTKVGACIHVPKHFYRRINVK